MQTLINEAIVNYEVLSDTEIKINGLIYTVKYNESLDCYRVYKDNQLVSTGTYNDDTGYWKYTPNSKKLSVKNYDGLVALVGSVVQWKKQLLLIGKMS